MLTKGRVLLKQQDVFVKHERPQQQLEHVEWGCPKGTKYLRSNQFKLPKLRPWNHFT